MTANRYQDDQPTRLALLQQSLIELSKSLVRMEGKIDKTCDELKTEIKDLRKDCRSDFRWIMTTMFLLWGSPLLIGLLKTLHLVQ